MAVHSFLTSKPGGGQRPASLPDRFNLGKIPQPSYSGRMDGLQSWSRRFPHSYFQVTVLNFISRFSELQIFFFFPMKARQYRY